MAGLLWKRDRISEVVRRHRDLEKAFQSAVQRLGPGYQKEAIRSLLGEWRHHLTELGSSVQGMAQKRTTHGRLTADSANVLRDSFAAVSRSAQEFDRRVVIGKGRRPSDTPPFREVYGRHAKLRKAIQSLLTPPVQRPERIDPETDPDYEQARKLRQAIRALDKLAAKNLSSEYLRLENLAAWCERIPISDWDDPRQLRRLARFYLASTITWQVWEIRYKSNAPGRPLNLLTITTDVPDPELLELYDLGNGDHDAYYIAATLPRWHIVWKFSRNDF
jgi:hypothetical protein